MTVLTMPVITTPESPAPVTPTAFGWWTDERCSAVHFSPYRGPIQCTREAHLTGGHLSLYVHTSWSGR